MAAHSGAAPGNRARIRAALARRRVSPAAEWARRVAAFSLVLFVTAGIGHRYAMVDTLAFLWTLALVAGLAVLGLALAGAGFLRLWSHGDRAGRASLAAMLLSALVLAPFAAAGWFYFRLPALTDISTDLHEPPRFTVTPHLRDRQMNPIAPISHMAATAQLRAYPDIAGRRLEASPDRVLAALAPVVASRGWRVRGHLPTVSRQPETLIEMEAPSFLLRFPADAVVRLTGDDETTFVDMRMAVRYGPHDLGANARRIRAFMGELATELERQSREIIDIPPSDGDIDRVD